jgi:methylmalonyl-CoA/ethylmalonyl-CoA epimerase
MTEATQEASNLGLDRIGQVALTVSDLDRATDFYRDALGMRFLFRAPGLTFFDCAGVRLLLGVPEEPELDRPSSIVYFAVDDLEAVHRALSARGVRFSDEPHLVAQMPDHELWMAFFEDSEGNTLALMSEVRRRSAHPPSG